MRYDEGIFIYYLRNIWKLGAGVLSVFSGFLIYTTKEKVGELNQDVMDMRVFRGLCEGMNTKDFFNDHIHRNISRTR